jgi:uncharacterized protein (TIGR03032 family)
VSQPVNQPSAENTAGKITVAATEGFAQWLAGCGGSLAVSCYQANKLALVGWNGRHASLLLRDFPRPLGLAVEGPQIAVATRSSIVLLANAPLLAPDAVESRPGAYDALYLARVAYHTGDLHVHDVAFGADGLWVVNTRFCCLASLSERFSFLPRWKPPFVSAILPEDRCHLNGVAMVDGQPRWATCLGTTDTPGGWRENKATGGVIVDVNANEVVVRGLSMPHSPRWYDNQLWVLNSGEGQLLRVDPASGSCDVVCTLPGYARGLCFHGRHAIVGLSQIREKHKFGGLPICERFTQLRCAVAVVDLASGGAAGMFEFTSGCQELFEVRMLGGVRQGTILSTFEEPLREPFTTPEFSCWVRPGAGPNAGS